MAITARELMQAPVVRVAPEDPLTAIQRLFADEQIHGAPVVDEQGRVVGVISSWDLLRAAADERDATRPIPGYFEDGVATQRWLDFERFGPLGEQRVGDVMTSTIVSVAPSAPIDEVARTLLHNQVHRVLVLEDGQLLGLISSFDLIGLLEKSTE